MTNIMCEQCSEHMYHVHPTHESRTLYWRVTRSSTRYVTNILFFIFESFFVTGEVTSPNFLGFYPNNLDKNYLIEVEQWMILSLDFSSSEMV